MMQLKGFLPLKFKLNPDPVKLTMDKIGQTISKNGDILGAALNSGLDIRENKNTLVPALKPLSAIKKNKVQE